MSKRIPFARQVACGASIAAAVAVLLSCASPDGSVGAAGGEPLAHHNWWNYYEQGCARYRAGDFAGARDSFEVCLGLRPGARFGYPEEKWRARTYGLHFVEGYFPHRELGICLYQLGDADGAVRYLARSLEKEPSARARHYLNRARAKTLQGSRFAPPAIRTGLEDGTLTSGRTIRVEGSAAGEGLVQRVTVGDTTQPLDLAAPTVDFNQAVALKEGINRIRVTAADLCGGEAETILTVIADWRPPDVALRKIDRQGSRVTVSGVCSDDRELASLAGNGRSIAAAGRTSVPFEFSVEEPAPLIIDAADRAGNSLRTVLTADDIASLCARACYDAFARAEGGAADAGAVAVPARPADRLKPSLELSSAGKTAVVFDEEYFLDGKASDGGGLGAVTVNGESLLAEGQAGALQAHFGRRLPLGPGTNVFEVAAEDLAGNRNVKTVSVVRQTPEYLDDEYRLRICFTPAANSGNEAQSLLFKRQAEEALAREPVRFRLLERNDEVWDLISREHELSLSPLADPQAALRIGKMLPAELVLMSAMFDRGDGIELYAGVRETANGATVWSGDVYCKAGDESVGEAVGDLVMKIKQNFPLVEGTVVAVDRDTITIDAGADQGVRAGFRFLVMPDAGNVLKVEDTPAEIEIARVKPRSGTGRILPSQATTKVKAGDRIYAR